MAWTIEYTDPARKALRKLDRELSRRIVDYMHERVASLDDPREAGKALAGPMKGLWRYRVGDYRVLCQILDERIVVLVLSVGHRSNVYR